MSDKSRSRTSWLSRFKKRVSSVVAPSSPSILQNHLSLPPAPLALTQAPEGQAWNQQGPRHMFGGAHNFVMNNSVFNDYNLAADNFMKELLQETIIGAEFDSSARDPPPRCHPGTRLAIIQRCLDFIAECHDERKLRWVVGPAGVGKSAIMQMVTEKAPDGVVFTSIFLSVNGRRDGGKTIMTIAYQLAVKCGHYRQFIRDQISLDPSLLRKSMSVQFNKFIVEAVMHKCIFEPSCRFLVVIDGLDECDDVPTQRKLLELISNLCLAYPASPIAWIVSSRPEPHITSFFDNPEVRPVFTKEEIVIDSDEACEEVQRYLRDELKSIKLAHATLRSKRDWPLEHEFTKIASAAGGLFAYAATVIRYIGDSTHRGPAAQLRRVLEIIDAAVKDPAAGKNHPMDRLDALYKRILSNVPDDAMINTRKLLLAFRRVPFDLGFRAICNALELTEDDAYDAICYLHAVLKIPEPDKADDKLEYYHKSFHDFLFYFERSGFSHDFKSERSQLGDQIALSIVERLQDECDGEEGGESIELWMGLMKRSCNNLPLSWPGDERFQITDEEMRIMLYKMAMRWLWEMFTDRHNSLSIESISGFHAMTTCLTKPMVNFPYYNLSECAFDVFRDELTKLSKLQRVPLRTLDYAAVCGDVELRCTSPTEALNGWNPSCGHTKEQLEGLERRQGWSTKFQRYYEVDSGTEDGEDADIPQFPTTTVHQGHQEWVEDHTKPPRGAAACRHCSQRLEHQFISNPDSLAAVFVDSTQMSYVEFSFVEPDDGTEWRYRFLHSGRPTGIDR